MYTPSADLVGADQRDRAAADPALGAAGQYYAGSSSLGQETDVMHQYYTDHGHHHHAPIVGVAASADHHYHPHHLAAAAASAGHHHHHHQLSHQLGHHHHHHHHHASHYQPGNGGIGGGAGTATTESSLTSSGAFMSRSASQLSALVRSCCSKKCLLIFCLSLILLIFIFVISLSAYLNFLISASKTNLTPLSGRLRAAPAPSPASDQLDQLIHNRTSKEFLQKQREYEIILRGALDRTQNLLKTYPNHLVKLEVYSFRPVVAAAATSSQQQLWIYYRLFLNKKTLTQDGQLMKRKSPDEHLERQFLPRLTQQSLHSGFEQLLATFASSATARSSRSISGSARLQQQQQQQQALKSFDDQISRLMPIIESIDLQSIQVSPEFDMLALETNTENAAQSAMSDNLRALQPLQSAPAAATPTTTTVATPPANTIMVATGRPSADDNNLSSAGKKFTLAGYRENSTRPPPSTTTPQNGAQRTSGGGGGVFLEKHQQRKPTTTSTTTSTQPTTTAAAGVRMLNGLMATANQPPALISSSANVAQSRRSDNSSSSSSSQVVKLVSGQPVWRVTSSTTSDAAQLATTESSPARSNLPGDKSSATPSSNSSSSSDPLSSQQKSVSTSSSSAAASQQSSGGAHDSRLRSAAGQHSRRGGNNGSPQVNETLLMQMVAPYQKIEFSAGSPSSMSNNGQSSGSGSSSSSTTTTPRHDSSAESVVELWNKAVNGNGASNSPSRHRSKESPTITDVSGAAEPRQQQQGLISAPPTTIAGSGKNQTRNALDWNKISLLSSDVADTIRAELVNAAAATSTESSAGASTQKPAKVAPHLNQGGSLISVAPKQTANSRQQETAIVLNRDFKSGDKGQQRNATTLATTPTTTTTTTAATTTAGAGRKPQSGSTAKPPAVRQKQPAAGISNKKKKVVAVPAQNSADNSTAAANLQQQQTTRGIRIVDNFLATLEANKTQQLAANQALGAPPTVAATGRNKSQEAFNYNADNLAPTLPTTIELTRSTTAPLAAAVTPPFSSQLQLQLQLQLQQQQPTRTSFAGSGRTNQQLAQETAVIPHQQQSRNNVDFTTTASSSSSTLGSIFPAAATLAGAGITESSLRVQQQTNRAAQQFAASWPASQQWRPMASTTSNFTGSGHARTTHLIVPPSQTISSQMQQQRQQTGSANSNSGSQSPFAMPVLEHTGGRSSMPTTNHGGNDSASLFESHRTSRMRTAQQQQQDQMLNASTSANFEHTTLNLDDRIVDDFMITPSTGQDGSAGRATTLIPPLVLSSLSADLPGARIPPAAAGLINGRPRTKGPFAFETLKDQAVDSSFSSATGSEPQDNGLAAAVRLVERSLAVNPKHSSNNNLDEKILLRKRLFLDEPAAAASDPMNSLPATTNPIESLNGVTSSSRTSGEPQGAPSSNVGGGNRRNQPNAAFDDNYRLADRFGVRNRPAALSYTAAAAAAASGRVARQRQIPASAVRIIMRKQQQEEGQPQPFRCQYYGCKLKTAGGNRYGCLNYTQICDDFIDCQDESDELDCVSLLKYDDNNNNNNMSESKRKLSFSNGAGIIYLNRKGLLAPMCIDYVQNEDQDESQSTTTTTTKNKELIRQINTIGQYACSLQSFSRLVSVKINHHKLVDGADLIKNSKLFHRLSITTPLSPSSPAYEQDSSSSFRSGSSEHEVEISTSPECPSQRTVFVKCGGFECGQDSFSIIQDQNNNNSQAGRRQQQQPQPVAARNGLIISNNFPWLVKLYWMGSLSCHGYLIDELWLISSSECFVNKTTTTTTKKTFSDDEQPTTATGGLPTDSILSSSGWTAEISYEHYGGGDEYGEGTSAPIGGGSNLRRNIDEILFRDSSSSSSPNDQLPIVLAKLEEPVRFSPLNRPICLPFSSSSAPAPSSTNSNNKTLNSESLPDKHYRDCFTVGLPSSTSLSSSSSSAVAAAAAPGTISNGSLELNNNLSSPTQQSSLTLNKVKIHEIMDCFNSANREPLPPRTTAGRDSTTTAKNNHETGDGDRSHQAGEDYSNLICVSDSSSSNNNNNGRGGDDNNSNNNGSPPPPPAGSRLKKPATDTTDDARNNNNNKRANDDLTRVLICSTIQAPRSRSKWTVVGVQYNRVPEELLHRKQLLSQPDRQLFAKVSSQIDWIVDTMNPQSVNLRPGDIGSGNNSPGDGRLAAANQQQQQQLNNFWNSTERVAAVMDRLQNQQTTTAAATCNKFRCSSGECLSWSRICDGLYDCSSQDDEKDCHK